MIMIEIAARNNGAHRNQTALSIIPDGWAVIPDGMDTPNFPFGEIETEEKNGVQTVTSWAALPIPEVTKSPEEQIAELKKKLSETDYIACKIAEGSATTEEYAEQIAQRQKWRDEINELMETIG